MSTCVNIKLPPQTSVCEADGCTSVLVRTSGHYTCRFHAPCRGRAYGVSFWYPRRCTVCLDLLDTFVRDPPNNIKIREDLRVWSKGFQKNAPGKPFLPNLKLKDALFPKAGPSAVVPEHYLRDDAPPESGSSASTSRLHTRSPSTSGRSRMAGDSQREGSSTVPPYTHHSHKGTSNHFDLVDLSTDDSPPVEDQFPSQADVPLGSPPVTIPPSPPITSAPTQGFEWLGPLFSSLTREIRDLNERLSHPQAHVPPAPPGPPDPPLAPVPPLLPSPPLVPVAPLVLSPPLAPAAPFPVDPLFPGILSPPGLPLSPPGRPLSPPTPVAPPVPPADPAVPCLPPITECPDFRPDNPWRPCAYMYMYEDIVYTFSPLGDRPSTDFEFYPCISSFPHCYVRLAEVLSERDDIVHKDPLLMPHSKAQAHVVQEARALGFTSTGTSIGSRREASFEAPSDWIPPFMEKAFKACDDLHRDNKFHVPPHDESRPTSYLFPPPARRWKGVAETFTKGKLDRTCAASQLGEQFPSLPDPLLTAEATAKERLGSAIHTQVLIEVLFENHASDPVFAILAKAHLQTAMAAYQAFAEARIRCRRYVLEKANAPHEIDDLIYSSLWGKNLFPSDLVDSLKARSIRENKSLLDRWCMRPALPSRPSFAQPLPVKRQRTDTGRPQPFRPPQPPRKFSGPPHSSPVANRRWDQPKHPRKQARTPQSGPDLSRSKFHPPKARKSSHPRPSTSGQGQQ